MYICMYSNNETTYLYSLWQSYKHKLCCPQTALTMSVLAHTNSPYPFSYSCTICWPPCLSEGWSAFRWRVCVRNCSTAPALNVSHAAISTRKLFSISQKQIWKKTTFMTTQPWSHAQSHYIVPQENAGTELQRNRSTVQLSITVSYGINQQANISNEMLRHSHLLQERTFCEIYRQFTMAEIELM
jgi:hypothetical protein